MKKYSTAPAQGFTLVELIVVIVILAILATIAFLSFGSQSAAARDSKRKTDLSNIASTMNIAMAKGTAVIDLVGTTGGQKVTNINLAGTWAGGFASTEYNAWDINFNVLSVNKDDFKDPLDKTYKIGATKLDGGAFQLAATLENDSAGNQGKNGFVVWNYTARGTASQNLATAATWTTSIKLDSSAVGMFKKNDWVDVGGTLVTVSNISSDLATVTLSASVTGTTMKLNVAEWSWLIASSKDATIWVQNNSVDYYPY